MFVCSCCLLQLFRSPSHLTSHVSRLTSHVSRLTSHVSRLTSHVSRLTSHVLRLTAHGRNRERCELSSVDSPLGVSSVMRSIARLLVLLTACCALACSAD